MSCARRALQHIRESTLPPAPVDTDLPPPGSPRRAWAARTVRSTGKSATCGTGEGIPSGQDLEEVDSYNLKRQAGQASGQGARQSHEEAGGRGEKGQCHQGLRGLAAAAAGDMQE
ncbi:hypothetical protein D623_10011052 [Myotis brandtii]|uniref:Uncharacterized protein n=1 Tax=Myotis brandtii TaxID=109478 RepID=S7N1Z8_MYOBR|nr:hypothetical protein D623_10011052 [Myotis brandtii]